MTDNAIYMLVIVCGVAGFLAGGGLGIGMLRLLQNAEQKRVLKKRKVIGRPKTVFSESAKQEGAEQTPTEDASAESAADMLIPEEETTPDGVVRLRDRIQPSHGSFTELNAHADNVAKEELVEKAQHAEDDAYNYLAKQGETVYADD